MNISQPKLRSEKFDDDDDNNNNNNNEICDMWRQKAAQVTPIAISSKGVIPKLLSQSLTRLNLHPNTYIYNCKNL